MKYVEKIKLTHEASYPMAGSMNCELQLDVFFLNVPRPVVPGGAMAHSNFGRSVKVQIF